MTNHSPIGPPNDDPPTLLSAEKLCRIVFADYARAMRGGEEMHCDGRT